MDYYKAFIKLYGAAGAALEELYTEADLMRRCECAAEILKQAIEEVEEMEDEEKKIKETKTTQQLA